MPCCKNVKFQPRQTKAFRLSMVTAIPILVQSMSAIHANTNMKVIQESLGITPQDASWVLNVETIVTTVFMTITGKLSEKFGSTRIMTIGSCINAIFNILYVVPPLATHFGTVLMLRALAAVGLGLMVPSQMPVNFQLVQTGKLPIAISISSMMVPIGSIVGAFLSGTVATNIGWQYMCVIIGAIDVINVVCQLVFLPYNLPRNKAAKINFLGAALVSSGITCLIIGLVSFSQKDFIPVWASVILLLAAVALLVLFFLYDVKWAKVKIFSPQLWNQTLILSEIVLFCTCLVNYGERYFNSYELGVNLGVKTTTIGILLAVCGISVFVFSPITNVLQRLFITKITLAILLSCYCAFQILNAASISFFPSTGLYITCSFLGIGFYVGVVIASMSYNYAQTPPVYSQQIGVLNALMQCLGQSLGVASAVLVQNAVDSAIQQQPFQPTSISSALGVFALVLFVGVAVTLFLGVFKFERGKRGFTERDYSRTKTFNENLQSSSEMIETAQFSGEEFQTRAEKVLSYFSLYTMPPEAIVQQGGAAQPNYVQTGQRIEGELVEVDDAGKPEF